MFSFENLEHFWATSSSANAWSCGFQSGWRDVSNPVQNRSSQRFVHLRYVNLLNNLIMSIECRRAIGIENGQIRDSAFSATSQQSGRYAPEKARLNGASAWMTKIKDGEQYLQVSLCSFLQLWCSFIFCFNKTWLGFWRTGNERASKVSSILCAPQPTKIVHANSCQCAGP